MQQKPFTYALVCVFNIYGGKCLRHDYAIPNLTLGSVTGKVCDSLTHIHTHKDCLLLEK